jgi:hypothetical protein
MLLTITIFLFAFLQTHSFQITEINRPLSVQNLQFSNYTGLSITPTMVSYYVKTINEAYTYFRNDFSSNTNYIQNRLEGSYSSYFDVIIMTHNVTGSWLVYSIGGSSSVTWSGVNTAQPSWVYFINAVNVFNIGFYIDFFSHGSGIDSTTDTIIKNTLIQAEGAGTCACLGMSTINKNLENFDGNRWSIVCKKYASQTMFSRIRASGYRFDFTSPNDCEYVVWTI